jgi:sporulation protein YabP
MNTLTLSSREKLSLTGVVKVHSFDENLIIVDTQEGTLTIKGHNLHVNMLTLEKGEASIDGKVDSLTYSEKKNRIKHLFS